jgi:adenine deaminase
VGFDEHSPGVRHDDEAKDHTGGCHVRPAEYPGASSQWGTIEAGKRADFVFVSGNPLDDIANTARIRGVAVGGRWLDRSTLDQMIATGGRATPAEQ